MKKKLFELFFVLICFLTFNVRAEELVNDIKDENNNGNVIVNDDNNEKDTTDDLTNNSDEVVETDTSSLPTNENSLNVEEEKTVDDPTSDDIDDNLHGGVVYDIQKAKVIIRKVDENDNLLAGAKLQILDKDGNIIEEWVSTEEEYEVLLSDGTYTLHEVEAPEGYEVAEDQEIIVKIEIASLSAGVDVDPYPCNHYEDGQGNYGVMLYYVEIAGKKHEVYCINQELGTPDQNSIYDGEILNSVDIRDYTIQEVPVDAYGNKEFLDISDKDLTNQELYDKLVDIIYHRHKAKTLFPNLTESEIRYVTELALKNYTNTGLTKTQRVIKSAVPENYDKYDSYEIKIGRTDYIWYLYPWYRSFIYNPNAAIGEDIYVTNVGEGDAFGTLARHWSTGHNAKSDEDVRTKVGEYYELYQYLISDGDNHPEDMNLYIYSTDVLHKYTYKDVEYTEPYQNLLGITGYFEDVPQQESEVTMKDEYSNEKTSVTVKKVWADDENESKKRPEEITVTLLANGKEYESITLSEENEWEYQFTDLPVYDEGEKIEYTVSEENVPEGYVAAYEGDMETGFIIHNILGQGGDVPPHDNPQTGDNILLYLITLLISLIGLGLGRVYLKESK